jgi:hypothetical protein
MAFTEIYLRYDEILFYGIENAVRNVENSRTLGNEACREWKSCLPQKL